MTILFIGDIVGRPGREAVKQILPQLKKEHKFDLIIGNGENLSHGKGMTLKTFEEMRAAGIDFFTSGNHIWKEKEILDRLNDKSFSAIRPANYPPMVPGRGWQIVKTPLLKKLLVINLMGRVFFPNHCDCPFRKADEILAETAHDQIDAILIDFHAEATSEKKAFFHYLKGRVGAIVGTHTHVPTADAEISPEGTAYISDVGMTGLKNSVIGIDPQPIVKHFLTQLPAKHEITPGPAVFNAVILEFNEKGQAQKITQILKSTD